MLDHGTLAGTGKMVILPVDQGFEHGPARSFAPNPAGYDPRYHFQLAIDAGCNAYAAPLGFLEAGAAEYAGRVPTDPEGQQLATRSTRAATPSRPSPPRWTTRCAWAPWPSASPSTRPRRVATTCTRSSASSRSRPRKRASSVVVWSYPRGSGISKQGETAIDVCAYAAQIAAQLGAHIIKVKAPTDHIEQDAARKVYEAQGIKIDTLADRVKHVVQSAFGGRRIVIFSGGEAKGTEAVLEENRQTALGGGFGTIMGRNSFQRPHDEAVKLLRDVMEIHRTTWPS